MAELSTPTSADQERRTTAQLRRSPAAHLASAMRAAEITGPRGVSLREIACVPQVGVRARPGSTSGDAVESALQRTLPTACGETTGDPEGLHVIWLSPDEFLVVDVSRPQVWGEAERIAEAIVGLPGQVLDLSGNRTILELAGPSAQSVLIKGCHVDLHPRRFPVGHAVSTLLGPVQVIIHRSAEQTFRILPRSSYADYMARWLIDGMEEFSSPPVP